MRHSALTLLTLPLLLAGPANAQTSREPLAWPAITQDARPWTRWWWMGSAVDSANLSRELRQLAAAGFGGVEVTAIYGARGAEAAFVPYLTPQWVGLLAHTVTEAKRLGLGVDMPPGAGWRTGGALVPAADANASLHITFDSANGGAYVADIRFSGDKVKRPAPGGEGFALDVFSRAATDRFLRAYGERTAALPIGAIGSYFHDSFEYTGTGSSELFDFFRRRRGYDLARELPAMAGRGDAERVARVKSDYRETLDEMLLENFLLPLRSWAHARGSRSRNQAHGSPGNLLDLYAAADIPETEIFGPLRDARSELLVNKFASSAAHLAGLPLASAEAFTWLGEHWSATLDDVKQAADGLFVAGIDHLIYHGTAYSPVQAPWPGWQFYASSELNPRNAIWHDLPTLNQYVARVQSVLQAGEPDNDVLLYWPVWDSWHSAAGMRVDFGVHDATWLSGMPVGDVATELWNRGYGFDYLSDRLLAARVGVTGSRLRAGTAEYATVVVPRAQHMPVETLRMLIDLARDGATIVFLGSLPGDVPGLARLVERRAALAAERRRLTFTAADARGVRAARLGRGQVLGGERLEPLLEAAGVRRETMVDHPGVRFIRERWAKGGQYFISHSGRDAIDGWFPLATAARAIAIMDPMTGQAGLAELRPHLPHGVQVRLHLGPGASIVLRTFDAPVAAPRWPYRRAVGAPVAVSGKWSVSFLEGGPTRPPSFESAGVIPWTGRGDAEADRFAGTATYSLRFDAPSGAPEFLLDLGRVAESARVRLNGRELGTLVSPPFQLTTGPLLPTGNLLEVDVTNLSANRIRDLDLRGVSWKNFHDINYVGLDYKPFDASRWPLRASGLIGPVMLTPMVTDPPPERD